MLAKALISLITLPVPETFAPLKRIVSAPSWPSRQPGARPLRRQDDLREPRRVFVSEAGDLGPWPPRGDPHPDLLEHLSLAHAVRRIEVSGRRREVLVRMRDRSEREGLLVRTEDTVDRRRAILQVTRKGERIMLKRA